MSLDPELVKRLVHVERLTDDECGERFGMTGDAFGYHRRKMGIEQLPRGTVEGPRAPTRPLATEIVEENGLRITRCQPGYAHGFGLYRYTVQPRGRK